MTHHYQIIKQNGLYRIHEVIIDEELGTMWTEDPVYPQGETRDELRVDMTRFIMDAVERPILVVEGDEIVGEEEPITTLSEKEI